MSIKTRDGYTDNDAVKNVDSIVHQLREIKQDNALVLIVLLDRRSDAAAVEGQVEHQSPPSVATVATHATTLHQNGNV